MLPGGGRGYEGDVLSPIVSIIMPAYRSAPTIARAITSVQSQSIPAWELIVIDDASDDETASVVADLARVDSRIKLCQHTENRGAAHARNLGLSQARARFIAFLDADDEWLVPKLERQLDHMAQTGASLSYTGFWRQRAGVRHEVMVPPEVDYRQLLRGNVIGCLTAMVDRSAFDFPLFMPDIRRRQDYAFWLELLRRGAVAKGLQEPLATYHVTAQSLSSGRLAAMRATWSVYRRLEQQGVLGSTGYLAAHLLGRLWRG